MFVAETKVRVRYGETDQMGYLYYGNYALYYEVGRAEAIRELGLTYRQLEENGVFMPVAELFVTYLRPAMYDDLITIRTILKELPHSSRIKFQSELYNEAGELLNRGVVTLVFYDPVNKTKVNIPPYLKEKLSPFFINDIKTAEDEA